jgi:hypothetical protein
MPGSAADRVYFFVDGDGTPHFSNVPHDSRYRLLIDESTLASRFDERAAPLTMVVSAASAVAKGTVLEVSVAMPGSPGVRGRVDLVFDPAALVFDDATVDSDLVDEGRVRLQVAPGIASAFAADVWFTVRRDAPDKTVVRGAVVDLESEERRAVRGVAGAPVVIRLTHRPTPSR